MKDLWLQDVCGLNTQFLEGPIRAVTVLFHGLGGGYRGDNVGPEEIALGEAGILCVYPYYGPWSWMNRQARAFVDELIERIYREFQLSADIPLISYGGSMGGCSALLYCRYGRKTPVACCALYPVCDTVLHFTERPDLPPTFRHAFLGYSEPLDELLKEHSPYHQAAKMPDIPYLFIHGDHDKSVNKQLHSDKMVAKLRELGRQVDYREIPQMGHGCNVPLRVKDTIVDFIVSFRASCPTPGEAPDFSQQCCGQGVHDAENGKGQPCPDAKDVSGMSEEEKIFRGELFCPGSPELKAIKLRSHKLSSQYSRLDEDETEARVAILRQLLGRQGEGNFFQGPIFFHYGKHTSIGSHNFFNYNTTIQDDALVTIGNDNNFGPNFTIVTPQHPLLPDERRWMLDANGEKKHVCYAQEVRIGNDCWFGANVTVCPGVSIGDNCVIGAGAVVTHDIPANSVAAGVPCRVLRELGEGDSMRNKPEILGSYQI